MRERDARNGVKRSVGIATVRTPPPMWAPCVSQFCRDGGCDLPNSCRRGPMVYADSGRALKLCASWEIQVDLGRVGGPIVAKAAQAASDAAVDQGATAIVVSNHGARQLDTVAPTIRVLPEVVQAVKGQTEILLDGGIRRGSDVVKALCMGAGAVLVGRSYAYGLGAGGRAGVARAIDILKTDVIRTMKLLGCSAIKDLDGGYVDVPSEWTPDYRVVLILGAIIHQSCKTRRRATRYGGAPA